MEDQKAENKLHPAPPPTEEQIRIMRAYDSLGFLLGKGKRSSDQAESFDHF